MRFHVAVGDLLGHSEQAPLRSNQACQNFSACNFMIFEHPGSYCLALLPKLGRSFKQILTSSPKEHIKHREYEEANKYMKKPNYMIHPHSKKF